MSKEKPSQKAVPLFNDISDLIYVSPAQREIEEVMKKQEEEILKMRILKLANKWGWWNFYQRALLVFSLRDYKRRQKYPRLDGEGKSESIMLIGQNPSESSNLKNIWEDTYGKILHSLLSEVGISPEEVYTTNLYKYPTEKNRKLSKEEIASGRYELLTEIRINLPSVIVTLGSQAKDSFPENTFEDIPVVHAIHPSYVARFPEKKVEIINQLKVAKGIDEKTRIRKRIVREGNERLRNNGAPQEGSS